MDAPAMVMNKHVPEDVGQRNIAAAEEEGGQGQMHRRGGEEKQHKPVLKKVKEKVKKIKKTIAGGGHGGGNNGAGDANGAGAGGEHGGGSSSSGSEEGDDVEDAAAVRMGDDVDQGGYQEDVEDKPVVAMDSDPEVHGAPMYDSAKVPAAERDVGGGGVRLGDIGGDVVEDPAAPNSTTPAPRQGEDIGSTPVVRAFEAMSVSDGDKHVGAGAGKPDEHPMPVSSDVASAGAEEWKDAPTDAAAGENAAATTYTEKIKSAAAGTTEYGKKLATTVYEKVAGVGTVVAGKVQAAGSAIPGVGTGAAATQNTSATAAAAGDQSAASGQQDKGGATTVTGYIADVLRPGDEHRELSQSISGAVQRRKDDVAQRVPAAPPSMAPAQVLAKAREAVTSLAGGARVSETVQPATTTDERNVMADGTVVEEAPVVGGEEIGDPQPKPQPNISMT
uniref:Uncharacterized protein n=1 Tax=Leersia perrieri TaxID=77586 RepID=A0A0D9XLA1_9ORYZ